MDRGIAVALATAIGGALALQAPLNSMLGRSVGGLTASIVACSVGLAARMAPSSPRFNDLVTAVIYGDAFAVHQLLGYGKWPDKPDSRGVTPLMVAAQLGDATVAEALLKAGANPNHPGPGGETATVIARERSDAALLGLLKRYGGK